MGIVFNGVVEVSGENIEYTGTLINFFYSRKEFGVKAAERLVIDCIEKDTASMTEVNQWVIIYEDGRRKTHTVVFYCIRNEYSETPDFIIITIPTKSWESGNDISAALNCNNGSGEEKTYWQNPELN
jgi:hypothetical protein